MGFNGYNTVYLHAVTGELLGIKRKALRNVIDIMPPELAKIFKNVNFIRSFWLFLGENLSVGLNSKRQDITHCTGIVSKEVIMNFTLPNRRSRGGFTLIELLVVVAIISILATLGVGAALRVRKNVKMKTVRLEITSIEMALAAYKKEFRRYPPDRFPSETATALSAMDGGDEDYSETLVYYLGSTLEVTQEFGILTTKGPYIEFKGNLLDNDGDGLKGIENPYGGWIMYAENASSNIGKEESEFVGKKPKSFDIVSSGPDGILGGSLEVVEDDLVYTPDNSEHAEDDITNWSK